ncbi:helix-turn-helix domain-containing protein [Streptomyces sp. RFCAC02]|uniref:winged helix-turn-helix transcriptional regulator n=1 Tax=Streptomyces sp. RFCAC02 TaxID=2499143 RepID=UPI001020939B|nr:helix-turn-helix domain-containing protein [Streptomyces sp. RFCAC02]
MPEFLADCRARLAFDLLAHTWDGVVLWALRDGPCRPRELRRRVGGISPKVLTGTLHRLRDSGLVSSRRHREAPPRVEYALTPLGRSLLGPLEALGAWAAEHGDEVARAREDACAARLRAGTTPASPAPGRAGRPPSGGRSG